MAVTSLIPRLKTPGVYVEEIPKLPPSIAQVETAIPAFIGYTEKAKDSRGLDLTNEPKRITSLLEYERFFGGAQPETGIVVEINENSASKTFEVNGRISDSQRKKFLMYYALQLFFSNGGGPCWIVSVGNYESTGGEIVQVDLLAGLRATERVNEITLYVFPDARGLTTASDYYGLYTEAIDLCVKLQDRFTVADIWHDPALPPDDWFANIEAMRNGLPSEVERIKYGASYFPELETTLDFWYGGEGVGDSRVTVNHAGGDGSLSGTLEELRTKNNALYFRARAAIRNIPCVMPPSPAMVGVYARVDVSRGVWKAPANVGVNSVIRPTIILTDEDQSRLNVDTVAGKSVNVIRAFTGRGIIVWGARTLAGNDNEWRYVPVRRFFNMVEESAKNASAQFVFEPNNRNTWTRVRSMIENFLTLQWRAGALIGTTTEEAYYVRVGLNETMDEFDIFEGRMIVEIGMAVVRPAEFIILQFSHKMLAES
ncbi:MAG TPA: phage tail sheath C-terminal domain-containing protein [Nitrospira sp.]|nr:phage tail sheath C-terminal domain-containing protein [Nitrospira sp.]HNA25807.1 phage tail sheath C-terminal domain-containing protein [Nitrospira sp.]HNK13020.1 phage tail sheath C-terminal domain-containing protein [Nitrospira sp.]HNL87537.1 phage tail sheath C-terminal domain-containing protein [Nitrospira sp.]HNN40877.1 phage tail sheath C-terminal domain-containing protein [Nitrospira sp.]